MKRFNIEKITKGNSFSWCEKKDDVVSVYRKYITAGFPQYSIDYSGTSLLNKIYGQLGYFVDFF